jgi:hypothetical protein
MLIVGIPNIAAIRPENVRTDSRPDESKRRTSKADMHIPIPYAETQLPRYFFGKEIPAWSRIIRKQISPLVLNHPKMCAALVWWTALESGRAGFTMAELVTTRKSNRWASRSQLPSVSQGCGDAVPGIMRRAFVPVAITSKHS